MAEQKTPFVSTWEDMEIDYHDWQTNPQEFANRVARKAREFAAILEKPNTISSQEEAFKSKALNNKEAQDTAQEFVQDILSRMMEFEPDVIANIMVRLPEVTNAGHNIIRAMSARKSRAMSKKRVHAMYVRLRTMYNSYVDYYKMFHPGSLKNPPIIPAKSGNYSSDTPTLGVKEFVFVVNGEEFLNYYTVARILGVEIEHYMDLVEIFQKNKKYTNGTVEYEIRLIDLSH